MKLIGRSIYIDANDGHGLAVDQQSEPHYSKLAEALQSKILNLYN